MSPWIRLSDSYIDHPKFLALTDGAFRLWHEGMSFCRKHQTDGNIPAPALQGFRYFRPTRVEELTVSLWERIDGAYLIHDYGDWNASKAEELQRKANTKQRTSRWRTLARRDASRDALVLDRRGSTSTSSSDFSSEKISAPFSSLAAPPSDVIAARAAKLLETFGTLYSRHRHGTKFLQLGNSVQWTQACTLCGTWDDETLLKLIEILLTTDDEWVKKTDRGWKIFVARAQWCAERLATFEAASKATQKDNDDPYGRSWACPHTPACGNRTTCALVAMRPARTT